MGDFTAVVPGAMNIPKVKFESNSDFQQVAAAHEGDSGFVKLYKKSWMQPKGDPRVNREVLTTLLASEGGECVSDCIEKLLDEEISYRDLGSLNEIDLELMGISNHKQREELLNFFKLLPNQDPSYERFLFENKLKFYWNIVFFIPLALQNYLKPKHIIAKSLVVLPDI